MSKIVSKKWKCPICGHTTYHEVRDTLLYECLGCSVAFWDPEQFNAITKIKKEINALMSEFQDLYSGDLSGEAVSLLLTKLRELIK